MDLADTFGQFNKIFTQSQPNRLALRFLHEMFGESLTVGIINNVSKNIKLFRLFQGSGCEKFMTIDMALAAINRDEISKQKVLIHFTELNLYGMFTTDEYTQFTYALYDRVSDDVNISYRPKQLILTGLPQKLVFVCVGNEGIVEKIRGYVETKYKCGITHATTDDFTEITVQGMGGNSFDEAQKTYNDLFNYIKKEQNDTIVTNKMLHMPITTHNDQQYVTADISYDLSKPQDVKDVLSALKTVHGGNIVINMVIVNGNVNGNVNAGVNNIGGDDNNKPAIKTMRWVRDNLPLEKEITTDYYNRYVANYDGTKINNSQFGKIVRGFGYITLQGTQSRFWSKK